MSLPLLGVCLGCGFVHASDVSCGTHAATVEARTAPAPMGPLPDTVIAAAEFAEIIGDAAQHAGVSIRAPSGDIDPDTIEVLEVELAPREELAAIGWGATLPALDEHRRAVVREAAEYAGWTARMLAHGPEAVREFDLDTMIEVMRATLPLNGVQNRGVRRQLARDFSFDLISLPMWSALEPVNKSRALDIVYQAARHIQGMT